MEESLIRNIINVLRTSSDKSVIYKALVKLRTDLVKDRDGIVLFRKCAGIPAVVRLLNRPYEKILDMSLSILANCCTELDCCIEAEEKKILLPLITILKSVPNPNIQCRACRLLGNLARERKIDFSNHSAAISHALCLILEESTELSTIAMAVRAAKILSASEYFLKDFTKCDGFKILMKILATYLKKTDKTENIEEIIEEIKPIGLKSSQPRERYFEEVVQHLEGVRSDIFDHTILKHKTRKSTDLIMPQDKATLAVIGDILRSIQYISELQPFIPSFEAANGRLDFSCLVLFVDDENLFRTIALQILTNFSKNPCAKCFVSDADAVSAACDLITNSELKKPLTEHEIRHCLTIIGIFSTNSCNRSKIRRSGALNKLVEIAKSSNNHNEISNILYTVNNFQFDHLSMDLLLRSGLVGILIKELNAYLNSDGKYRRDKNEEKKRSSKKKKCSTKQLKCFTKKMKISPNLNEPESSSSSNSFYSILSPCSSRSISPASSSSKNCNEFEDSDPETYSPVCSDNDEDEKTSIFNANKPEDVDVLKWLDICSKPENNIDESLSASDDTDNIKEDSDSNKNPSFEKFLKTTIDIIENLLYRISLLLKNRGELSKTETLRTIIEAINKFGINTNGFGNTLSNIISDSQFFIPIMKQDVIYRIYQMTKVEELKPGGDGLLDTLICVGESGYGRGELTRSLMKGESNLQKKAAIAVAFIIRTPKILYTMLTENDAIYILINTILNKNDEYRFEAAEGLTSLSQTLGINLPICDMKKFDCEREFDEYLDFPVYENSNEDINDNEMMKFILLRGCSKVPIKFCKKLLTENCDVFNSMLNSDFLEGNKQEIQLREISVHGIKYFLNLINLESKGKHLNIPPIYYFDSILEAYELARMYILKSLEDKLFTLIIYRLCEETSLKVFQWALKKFDPPLIDVVINYYLSTDLKGPQKVNLFHRADVGEYSKEWNQMLIDTVLGKCQNLCTNLSSSTMNYE